MQDARTETRTGRFGENVGVFAQEGARVVLEDVDVVGRQGAGCSRTVACFSTTGGRLELIRCARGNERPLPGSLLKCSLEPGV